MSQLVIKDTWDQVEKPWQKETRNSTIELVKKIEKTFDVSKLKEDYYSVKSKFDMQGHTPGSAWRGVNLTSFSGSPSEFGLLPGSYKETPAMLLTPYIKSVLDSIDCEKKRVRFIELLPGYTLNWHVDGVEMDASLITRFHIAIDTNENVLSQASHVDYFINPGEFYFIDTRFPHRVGNFGETPRVHLVCEFLYNNHIENLIGIDLKDPNRRIKASRCTTMINRS